VEVEGREGTGEVGRGREYYNEPKMYYGTKLGPDRPDIATHFQPLQPVDVVSHLAFTAKHPKNKDPCYTIIEAWFIVRDRLYVCYECIYKKNHHTLLICSFLKTHFGGKIID
jgi:hypothetical protein